MEKSRFLALKDLFEQYQTCEKALNKLMRTRKLLNSKRLTNAGVIAIELGFFRTQLGAANEVDEKFRQVVLDMFDQLTGYYQGRLEDLNQAIEAA